MSVFELSIDPAKINFFPRAQNLKQMDFRTSLEKLNAPVAINSRIYLDMPGPVSSVSIPSIARDAAEVIRNHFNTLYEPMYVVHEDKSCTADHAMPISLKDEARFRTAMAAALNRHGVSFKMFVNRGFVH